jgi:hypothetical protein
MCNGGPAVLYQPQALGSSLSSGPLAFAGKTIAERQFMHYLLLQNRIELEAV